MTTIYTVRLSSWAGQGAALRACDAKRARFLDITRGSGGDSGAIFAPSQRILDPALAERKRAQAMRARDPHKADRVELAAWATYCEAFAIEMEASQKMYPEAWEERARGPDLALACYCGVWTMGTGATVLHCHRVLVAALFEARGCRYGGELETL